MMIGPIKDKLGVHMKSLHIKSKSSRGKATSRGPRATDSATERGCCEDPCRVAHRQFDWLTVNAVPDRW
jgi:hypothetical protein